MQIEKISPTLSKITLTFADFTVSMGICSGEDGILLIDTGWTQTAEELKRMIHELDNGGPKLILLTHQHGDHIGGRTIVGPDAILIAHKNTKNELAGKYHHLDPLPGQKLPVILLENELSLHFNGQEIRLIPAPGHTDSDVLVYFQEVGIVFMGDLIFSDSFPGLFTAWGGNIDNLIQSLTRLTEDFPENTRLIVGHGRDYTIEDLRDYREMVLETSELIGKELSKGKDSRTMAEEGLLNEWETWSTPQISTADWINSVCDSMMGKSTRSISDPLSKTIVEKGIKPALAQYRDLKESHPEDYNFGESELNMLGYQLLWRDLSEEARAIFQLNVEAYPESANPYDSLGEACQAVGDLEGAIENYQKALDIDPEFPSAVQALKELREV